GVPPAFGLPASAVWQPMQLPRWASSAPFATASRENDGGCWIGSRRSCDAQPAKPVSTASATATVAPPITDRSVALCRVGGRGHGYAVLVDHFATEPARDDKQHQREER